MYDRDDDLAACGRALPAQTLAPPEAYVGYVDLTWRPTIPLPVAGAHPTPTVARVLRTRCAGYAEAPTPQQVCGSLSCIENARGCPAPADVWLTEATLPEIMDGWLEGAYRLDALVSALHGHATRRHDPELVAWLNAFRRAPHAQRD